MDKTVFIKELKKIFIELNKNDRRYTKVWLSDENFGGLYHSGMYALFLKAAHKIVRYKTEVGSVIALLDEKLGKEDVPTIFTIKVFDEHEFAYPESNDIILYSDDVVTNAA